MPRQTEFFFDEDPSSAGRTPGSASHAADPSEDHPTEPALAQQPMPAATDRDAGDSPGNDSERSSADAVRSSMDLDDSAAGPPPAPLTATQTGDAHWQASGPQIRNLPGRYAGVLFIGDPHIEARTPGFRKDDYPRTVLAKLGWCLDYAIRERLTPVLLGDLFQLPRDNPNWLIVELVDLFRRYAHRSGGTVSAIYGNHDVHENQLDEHDSLSILDRAGCLQLLDGENALLIHGPPATPESGEDAGTDQDSDSDRGNVVEPVVASALQTNANAARRVLIGGTPWGQSLPQRAEIETLVAAAQATTPQADQQPAAGMALPPWVVWVTHHDLSLPGYEAGSVALPEGSGLDIVVNGHVHRQLDEYRYGGTVWLNPGNITRRKRSDATRQHVPSVLRLDILPSLDWQVQRIMVPHQAFDEVFYEAIIEETAEHSTSSFVAGLAELKNRKTETGAGLGQFLELNLPQFSPEVADEIRHLASEVLERPLESDADDNN